uniref:MARVEL domain-containing protein n=1 Tax=Ditylum brightwellii TaxID=49249 RepID=A0A6V2BQS3_9STRA
MANSCRLFVLLLSLSAFCLTSVALFSCGFVQNESGTVGYLGWHLRGGEKCQSIDVESQDGIYKAGLAFAVIAWIFSTMSLITSFVMLFSFSSAGPASFPCLSCLFLFTAMCNGLSLMSLSSSLLGDVKLNLDVGAECAIASIFIYLFATCFAIKASVGGDDAESRDRGAAEPLLDDDNSMSEDVIVTTTEKEMEDGSKIIERVTTYPDGRKEITTTTETPV